MQQTPSTLKITTDSNGRNATFVIDDEDHTVGNSLRYVVSTNRAVELVGYSVPHPSHRNINLRVQTKPNADINAIEAVKRGIEDLQSITSHIKTCFEVEFGDDMEE